MNVIQNESGFYFRRLPRPTRFVDVSDKRYGVDWADADRLRFLLIISINQVTTAKAVVTSD
jgi:hypothetical protein